MPGLSLVEAGGNRVGPTSGKQPERPATEQADKKTIQVYIMDLWSFIPYYVAHLCARLREKSVNVILGSARYHLDRDYFSKVGLTTDRALLDFGGSLKSNALRRVVKSFEYVINLVALAGRFRLSPPDILHVQFTPFLERGFPVELHFMQWVKRLRIPIVYTVHNVTAQNRPDQNLALYRRAYCVADALICHGEEAKSQLIREFNVSASRVFVIPHGPLFDERPQCTPLQAREKLDLPPDEPVVLCQGVISEYKGIPFLLEAWEHVVQLGVRARLVIAGTGNPELLAYIRELVRNRNLSSSVTLRFKFISVEELPLYYQAADILVYPYKAGTTSGALLTGIGYGKALIGTTLAMFKELLTHGENGLLVEYGDVKGLGNELATLISDANLRERLARKLQCDRKMRASWSEIADATLRCYGNVLARRQ